MSRQESRPKYLDLLRIRMPAGAVASFAHRVAGLLMVLAIPFVIHVFELSLQGPAGFAHARELLGSAPMQAVSVLLVWALAHHVIAGLRFLLIDLEIGVTRLAARRGAWLVNLMGLAVALVYAGMIA